MKLRSEIMRVLHSANREPKGDYRVYVRYKQEISRVAQSNTEYEEAIRRLCEILEV